MFETKISLSEYIKGNFKSFEQTYNIKPKEVVKEVEVVKPISNTCTCLYKTNGVKNKAVLDYILREIRIDGQVVRRF